jgi:hypothetical protein
MTTLFFSRAKGSYPVEQLSYFAVYPDGRRCSVTAADAQTFGARWEEDGVKVVTECREVQVPIVGQLVHILP